MKYIVVILLLVLSGATSLFAQHKWVPVGVGANLDVYSIYTDVTSNLMYVGGGFNSIGGVSANAIAKYNGQNWMSLGSGVDGSVSAIISSGTKIYVAGYFTTAGGIAASNIAVYDTITGIWSALGTGTDDVVTTLALYNGDLYAGGWFLNAGGLAASYIAKWDGANWQAVGGGLDDAAYAMVVYNGQLYVGGRFINAGGATMNYITRWDGVQWSTVTSGTNLDVKSLQVHNNELYVGGEFDIAGDSLAYKIAKWNGTTWFPVMGVVSGPVNAMLSDSPSLYLGGDMATVNGITVNNVVALNGTIMNKLGDGLDTYVYTLSKYKNVVYAGGAFIASGPTPVAYIAKWCDVDASASSNVTICAGDITTLTASGGDTYSWSSGGTTSSIAVSPTVTTTYTATVSKNGCSDTALVNVFVNSLPSVAISGNTTVCSGTNSTLTASAGGVTYLWNTGSTASAIVINPTTQTNYSVVLTDANNCSSSATTTVTVNSLPNAVINGNTTICQGGISTLTASGGISYLWNTGSTDASIVVAPTTQTNYSATITDANNCSALTTTTVVISIVNPGITGNTTICNGGASTLTASGGVSYSWNTGSTATSIVVNPTTQTDYSVTVTDIYNCSASTSSTITVNPLPAPSISISGSSTICSGTTSTLSASGGVNYSWSTGSTATSIVVNPTTQTNYFVTATDGNSCSASTASTIYIHSSPDFTVAPTNASCSTCCDGFASITTTGGTSPFTYLWNTSPVQTTGTATGLCVGDYTATITDANGCTSTNTVSISFSTGAKLFIHTGYLSVEIFPNPFMEETRIVISDLAAANNCYHIQLFDVCGKRIKQFKVNSHSFVLNRDELQQGIYFIKIISEADNRTITRKLIIE